MTVLVLVLIPILLLYYQWSRFVGSRTVYALLSQCMLMTVAVVD